MRKEDGSLVLYVNGQEQGVVVTGLPKEVYGVVDVYAQCVKVAICRERTKDHPVSGLIGCQLHIIQCV